MDDTGCFVLGRPYGRRGVLSLFEGGGRGGVPEVFNRKIPDLLVVVVLCFTATDDMCHNACIVVPHVIATDDMCHRRSEH